MERAGAGRERADTEAGAPKPAGRSRPGAGVNLFLATVAAVFFIFAAKLKIQNL
jgi:hypothetical protein